MRHEAPSAWLQLVDTLRSWSFLQRGSTCPGKQRYFLCYSSFRRASQVLEELLLTYWSGRNEVIVLFVLHQDFSVNPKIIIRTEIMLTVHALCFLSRHNEQSKFEPSSKKGNRIHPRTIYWKDWSMPEITTFQGKYEKSEEEILHYEAFIVMKRKAPRDSCLPVVSIDVHSSVLYSCPTSSQANLLKRIPNDFYTSVKIRRNSSLLTFCISLDEFDFWRHTKITEISRSSMSIRSP